MFRDLLMSLGLLHIEIPKDGKRVEYVKGSIEDIKELIEKSKTMSNITDIEKLNFYSWTNDGMDENPNGIPSEDVFVLRSDVIAALQNKVSDISAEAVLKKWFLTFKKENPSENMMSWEEAQASPEMEFYLKAMEEYASIVNERKDSAGSYETPNEVLNEVLGIAVKAHLFKQLNQMDDFIEEMKKFENFEIKKK